MPIRESAAGVKLSETWYKWPLRSSDAKPAPEEPLRPLMLLNKDGGKGGVRRIDAGKEVVKLDLHARFSFVQPARDRKNYQDGIRPGLEGAVAGEGNRDVGFKRIDKLCMSPGLV